MAIVNQYTFYKRGEAPVISAEIIFKERGEPCEANAAEYNEKRFSDNPAYNMAEVNDEILSIKRAQAGDERAFAHLIQPYIRKAYHVALKITRNREDAEDASQQSFLNDIVHIDQFRGRLVFPVGYCASR